MIEAGLTHAQDPSRAVVHFFQGLNVGQFKEYKDYGTHYGLVSEDPQWEMISLVSGIRKSGNKT
jgi:hypothetical protein